ncbi:hypothetical protein [Spiroplasma endosymbiont of Phycita roborella]|uniref:hypothetical protein n=1 Tax=Spiroplasma endosymbiont of Phycita roborella TaxID=3066311 RepID=UPI00313C7E70
MKTWIKTNLSKITLALALTGAVSGVTGLIIGSIAHNKVNDLKYYLDYDGNVHWGGSCTTIWERKTDDIHKITLYLSINPTYPNVDIKWDGIYPVGYFNKKI